MVIASSSIPDPSRLAVHSEALYRDAFFSILTDRYFLFGKTFELDAHSTPNICSGWMTYALASGKDRAILSEILLALSSVVVAADLQDPSISEDSRRRYQRAIGGISRAIEAHNSAANNCVISESILMTCLACAKYEVSITARHSSQWRTIIGSTDLVETCLSSYGHTSNCVEYPVYQRNLD